MIRTLSLVAVLALGSLAVAGGCASTNPQIPVNGEDPQITRLAGEWLGDYRGLESGREGTIEFDLGVGRHTAEGQVMMKPAGATGAGVPLRIKFVQVMDGRINGKIEPYMDPQCSCKVETEFFGDLRGDRIHGEFVTRALGNPNAEQFGLWSVSRSDS